MLIINHLCTDAHYPPTAVLEGLSLQWEKVHFMWVSEPVQTLNFSCTKLNTAYIQSGSTQMIQVWWMLQTSNLLVRLNSTYLMGWPKSDIPDLNVYLFVYSVEGIGFDTWTLWCLNWRQTSILCMIFHRHKKA